MPLALILSSFVAASRIGGAAQQYVLAAHKIDPVLAPTVMFGRTPARGGRGEVTQPDVFRRMLGAVAWVRRHQVWVTRAGGAMLVLVGVLLVTGVWDLWVGELRNWVGGFEVAV